MSDLFGNPEDRFSRVAAHFRVGTLTLDFFTLIMDSFTILIVSHRSVAHLFHSLSMPIFEDTRFEHHSVSLSLIYGLELEWLEVMFMVAPVVLIKVIKEPVREKTNHLGFRPGQTQTGLLQSQEQARCMKFWI